MTRFKAVMFDMDGVLIDARDWHYEALNDALQPFGLTIGRDEHLTTFDGLPTKRKLDILSGARGLPKALHETINALKQKHTVKRIVAYCRPVFQHRFMLAQLQREGLKLAMCSNSIRRTVDMMAELARIDEFFDVMLSNEDVKNSKPDPEIYLLGAKRLGVDPRECLVVEDNDNGMKAAQAAGCAVLHVGKPSDVDLQRLRAALAA